MINIVNQVGWKYQSLEDTQIVLCQCGEEEYKYFSPMRGQSDSSWDLSCSLFRNRKSKTIFCKDYFGSHFWDNNIPPIILDSVGWVKNEMESVERAIAIFPQLAFCAIAQHDGRFKTPLLDVSMKVYAPLYFACKENFDKDGALFRFEVESPNRSSFYERKTSLLNFGLLPTAFGRMRLQDGIFLYTMSCENSLRKDVGHHVCFCDISESENITALKYIIPKELKCKILSDLKIKFKTDDLDAHFGLKPKI